MNIRPIIVQFNKINFNSKKKYSQTNSIECQFPNKNIPSSTISFSSLLHNSDLLNMGYSVANIVDNKISNNNDSIIITSAEKFLALLNSPNTWSKKIVLANDIDLDGKEIKPIGNVQKPFKGVFDGNGCKISNFKINCPEARNIGLFGKCENAKITNLEVKNAIIKGKGQVGGIVGNAYCSELQNCHFQGYITGNKNIGGLIGLSNENKIYKSSSECRIDAIEKNEYNPFSFDYGTNLSESIGGLIGSANDNSIDSSYANCVLNVSEQAGGLIGYAVNSRIYHSIFNGKITGNTKCGSFIGWAENSHLEDSYALSNNKNYIGFDINNTSKKLYNCLEDVMSNYNNWDQSIWTKDDGKIPRLKTQIERLSPKTIFLEDINNDIKIGKISKQKEFDGRISEEIKLNLSKPKHYEENNELLEKIKTSKDDEFLRETFGKLAVFLLHSNLLGQNSTDKYDEIFVALVQNKHMDINSTYEERTDNLDGMFWNIWCSPLFILTCMNKAYVLKEALKRDDADFTVGSGHSHKETILNQAFEHHIDECAYVLFKEAKMHNYIDENLDKLKAKNLSSFGKLLLECYPDKIPEYDEKRGVITFSQEFDIPDGLLDTIQEVKDLEDVQKKCEIDVNYRDSLGNNIVNIASTLDNQEEALRILIAAKKIGVDLNNWNKKSESPIGHAIYTNKPHFVAQILDNTNSPFTRLSDGTDAMLMFSKMNDESCSINYMDIARKRGLSLNTSDENGNTPLINAINLGHKDCVKYLLGKGANPNKCDNNQQTPLHHACINADIEIINMLLDIYANINIKDVSGNLPFDYLNNDLKSVLSERFEDRAILDQSSGLNTNFEPTVSNFNLDYFEKINSLKDISEKILNEENVDHEILQITKNLHLNQEIKNLKDDNNNTILHLIAQSPSSFAKECLELAIEKGLDINALNDGNETPLISSINAFISAGTIEKKLNLMQNIKTLLDTRPNVDLVDNNKQSALHKICQSGDLILFNEILKLNPKINQVDINGNTPFKYIPANANIPMYITAREYLKNNKIITS